MLLIGFEAGHTVQFLFLQLRTKYCLGCAQIMHGNEPDGLCAFTIWCSSAHMLRVRLRILIRACVPLNNQAGALPHQACGQGTRARAHGPQRHYGQRHAGR